MAETKLQGFTDKAAESDDFSISRYINGLADFIQTCNTPMTIAVQGDWGSGKTSIMNMVRQKLNQSVKSVWFNTWQYSQFNMGDQLAVSFLGELVRALDVKDQEKATKFQTVIRKLGNAVRTGAVMYVDSKVGGKAAEGFENVLNAATGNEEEPEGIAQTLTDLRAQFELCVKSSLEENGKDRVVIFVDDLDRLNPGRAVELLEVLKLFLDCENCVFVLAIDYNVVSRGVKEKYGSDFNDEKGRSFFDKIIQVPFKMPVAQYDITGYIINCFRNMGIPYGSKSQLESYTNLINHSIGNNPRSMKRLFNSYLLLSKVADPSVLESDQNKRLLFAILCIQSKFESIYNYIVANKDSIDADFLLGLKDEKNPIFKELKMSDDQIVAFTIFATDFNSLIDTDNSNMIDAEEFAAFQNVLNASTLTSTNADAAPLDELRGTRYAHRDKCRTMINKLNAKYHVDFKDYYRRSHELGTWWLYIYNKRYPLGDEEKLGIGFECKLAPSSKTKDLSTATISVYTRESKDFDALYELVGGDPIPSLGKKVKPTIDNTWGITYSTVCIFDTYGECEELYSVVEQAFLEMKDYLTRCRSKRNSSGAEEIKGATDN